MSCQKRKANKEESEKTTQSPAKRGCFFEEPSSPKKKNLTVGAEKSSRLYTSQYSDPVALANPFLYFNTSLTYLFCIYY